MKYRYLNEVLLNWNSSKSEEDNRIIKSKDINTQLKQIFIYRIDEDDVDLDKGAVDPRVEQSELKIFGNNGLEWEKYKDKVYVNGEHVLINKFGKTEKQYGPGIYKVYIKDIDKITNCSCLFNFTNLVSVPLFDTSNVKNMTDMFYYCRKLEYVPALNTNKLKYYKNMFFGCPKLDSNTKEIWKKVLSKYPNTTI